MDRLKWGIVSVIVASGIAWPGFTRAAEPTVHLIGPVGLVQAGTIFPIEIRLDTGGANINAAELTLRVAGEASEITSLGRESSIFTLWPETPSISGATARFAGGRPGGVVAVDALVGTIFVIARQAGPVAVSLVSVNSAVYRHDGVGTKIAVLPASVGVQVADDLVPHLELTSITHPTESDWGRAGDIQVDWDVQPQEQFSYRLSNDISIVPDDDLELSAGPLTFNGLADGVWYFVIKRRLPGEPWSPVYQRRFLLDRTPPEPFTLAQPDRSTVNGRSLLTWTALDRTSGEVSYYGFVDGKSVGPVTSPLTLRPDWQGKRLHIVAQDAAGNQRFSQTWMYGQAGLLGRGWMIVLAGVGLIVIAMVLIWVARRR